MDGPLQPSSSGRSGSVLLGRRKPSSSAHPMFPSAAASNPHNLPLNLSAAGSHLVNTSLSFSRLVRSRNLSAENFAASAAVAGEESSAGCDADPCSIATSSSVPTVKRVHPNALAFGTTQAPQQRLKSRDEGNFVKLNINGYSGRRTFKSARGRYSAKSWNRKGAFRKSVGKKAGCKTQDDEEMVDAATELAWEQGRKLKCGDAAFETAVAAAREDPSDENLVALLKVVHGHENFREGQLEAIRNTVAGESTMLVLPTGAGKSLCYQLPALILPGLTLVVSPLLSLMVDQLKKLPPFISGGLLGSNQSSNEFSETLERLHRGEIKVLFVSPERFLAEEFLSLFEDALSISLVVIDEAHCMSEWSHNFRPSYMRLRASLLQRKLNVRCVLAMTATATAQTLGDVMNALEISSSNLIRVSQIRENLQLSISLSNNRSKDLLLLLKSTPFVDTQSIIVYCKFQAETDMVCKLLCDNNIPAKSYHSGIPTSVRNRVQDLFCSNKIRVIVATVAFGMGLDKSDVGGVIHYSLPESLEEYTQETGRAGRDGRVSYCHLLFDTATYYKIRSLLYSDGVDDYAISKLVQHIFSGKIPQGNIQTLIRDSTSQKFDIKEEVILTILTQLEIGEQQYIQLLPQLSVTCLLNFHKTSPELLSYKNTVVRSIVDMSEIKSGKYVFDIPTIANSLRITPNEALQELHNLQSLGEVSYELKDPAYCFILLKRPDDYCSLSSQLTKWLTEIENSKIKKVDAMFHVAKLATTKCTTISGGTADYQTSFIQEKINEYFGRKDFIVDGDMQVKMAINSPFLHADIKVFLQRNSFAKFTPRAVARIMHGISSPAFPSATWSKNHFWGRYVETDFSAVMDAAKSELVKVVGGGE